VGHVLIEPVSAAAVQTELAPTAFNETSIAQFAGRNDEPSDVGGRVDDGSISIAYRRSTSAART
jgi:hypothetical protein